MNDLVSYIVWQSINKFVHWFDDFLVLYRSIAESPTVGYCCWFLRIIIIFVCNLHLIGRLFMSDRSEYRSAKSIQVIEFDSTSPCYLSFVWRKFKMKSLFVIQIHRTTAMVIIWKFFYIIFFQLYTSISSASV